MSQQGSKAVKDGIQVIQGTPTAPITSPTLFLRLWRVKDGKDVRTRATLFMVRPGPRDYVIKELIPDMELDVKGPTFAGDTIHCEIEVIEQRPASKGGRGLVRTRNTVINQRGETVLVYTPLRMMAGQPEP